MLPGLLTANKSTTYYNKEIFPTNTYLLFFFPSHKCFVGPRASLVSLTFAKTPPKKPSNICQLCLWSWKHVENEKKMSPLSILQRKSTTLIYHQVFVLFLALADAAVTVLQTTPVTTVPQKLGVKK